MDFGAGASAVRRRIAMSATTETAFARGAMVLGVAWVADRVLGLAATGLMALAATALPKRIAWDVPWLLGMWFILVGIGTGLTLGLLMRDFSPPMSSALVGVLVGAFALVQYRFTGSPAGRTGEQAIRVVCSGLSAGVVFRAFLLKGKRDAA